jgi:tetratricopeptide (TPR) repeat protein
MSHISRSFRAALSALAVAAVVVTAAGPLDALGEGRILATVVDASGQPVPDAQILLTRPGTNYKQEKKTDKRGTVTLLVLDATKEYLIHIEKAGLMPIEEAIKPKVGDTLRMTYTLQPVAEAAPAVLSGESQAINAYNEGVTRLQAGDKAGAIPHFEEAAQLNPKLPDAQAILAELYFDQGKNAEALAAAGRYLELQPNAPRGLSVEYDAYLATGETAKADAALEALIQAAPGRDTAVRLLNKGVKLFNESHVDDAVKIFERVLQVDPTLEKTQYMLGLSYANIGDTEKAKEHLEKFLELAPNDENAANAKEMLDYINKK